MINGWDEVDWVQYEGAYGPATETPDIFRAIASTDPQTAADGRFEFYSSLHHQGSVYPATSWQCRFSWNWPGGLAFTAARTCAFAGGHLAVRYLRERDEHGQRHVLQGRGTAQAGSNPPVSVPAYVHKRMPFAGENTPARTRETPARRRHRCGSGRPSDT